MHLRCLGGNVSHSRTHSVLHHLSTASEHLTVPQCWGQLLTLQVEDR